MILKVSDLQSLDDFSDLSETQIETMILAVENLIRAYTHNHFHNRFVRFAAASSGTAVLGVSEYLSAGDTVEISQSIVNNGLYVVSEIGDDYTDLGQELKSVEYNLVTKVEYPPDVVQGVLNMLKWDVNNRDKVGIKAETLSRHSVTYYDQDSENTVMGYPVALLAFLKPYMKARF